MKTNQTFCAFSRISRISAAGILIAFSGSAVALAPSASESSSPGASDAPRSASRPAGIRMSAARASVSKKETPRTGADTDLDRADVPTNDAPAGPLGGSAVVEGMYTHVAPLLRRMHPNLRNLTDAEIFELVQQRYAQNKANAQGRDLDQPVSGEPGADPLGPQGGSGTLVLPMGGGRKHDLGNPGPGEWNNPHNVPPMGEGYRTDHSAKYLEEHPLNLARLNLRARLGGYADYSNLAFADTVTGADGGGIWPTLELPSNTQDFDGDGELFDPLPARPVVVYYQFLEEGMTNLDWDGGEDNFNQVRLTTSDSNDDDAIDLNDEADDSDGISDTWIQNPVFVNRSVIPPPNPADFDADLAPWLEASGFPTTRWGDDRPIFLHPDAEAAWRLAQRLYFSGALDRFQDTFDDSQVLEPEERELILGAMRAIEDVTNITFLERPDLPGATPPGTVLLPPRNNGYPLNAVGYTLDTSGVAIDPGGILGLPGASEFPWEPEDDYPWILIAKGGNPDQAENGPSGSSIVGITRNQPFPAQVDFVFTDLDGDGFPDTPDSDGDGSPDQVILSGDNLGNAINADLTAIRSVMDTDGNGTVNIADGTLTSGGALEFPVFGGNFKLDLNFDGTPDLMQDTNADGDPTLIPLGDIGLDLDGDGGLDSVFGGAGASPIPFPADAIPCELLGITQLSFDNEDIGGVVYQLMRHLGFLNEHQRPDRDDFVRINFGNIDADLITGFGKIAGGTDKFANFIENFDTTTQTIPPDGFTPRQPGAWTIGAAPASGQWAFATPAPGDGVAPVADFAVDADDDSAECLVTGLFPGAGIVGEAIFTSPNIYGPEDSTVSFAYWLNSTTAGDLQEGDGLIVQVSTDGGTNWIGDGVDDEEDEQPLIVLSTPSAQWREVSVVVGDARNDGATQLPDFRVRFIARNSDATRQVEMALDRIRVQNPYDYLSVMHFGTFAASIWPGEPGFETIEVREPNTFAFQNLIGLAQGLSLGDRVALSNLYGDPVVPDGDDPATDPCRADTDGDGQISALDVALFLEWFNAGDPRADFAPETCVDTNGDGSINTSDDTSGCLDVFDLVQFFEDVQNSFRCQNDPNNSFGENNLGGIDNPG